MNNAPTSLFVVIVLFKKSIDSCVAYQALLSSLTSSPDLPLRLKILLWDNTPASDNAEPLPHYVQYRLAEQNQGLAGAYNVACQLAREEGFDWLLTLDQDTALPTDYLLRVSDLLLSTRIRADVAAVVPQLMSGRRILSPYYFAFGAWPRQFEPGYSGIPERTIYAFNSGAILRLKVLEQIGGYDQRFWLDNSDASLFKTLSKFGKRIFVFGEVRLAHEFSMHKLKERVSVSRYLNIVSSETAFWDLEMSRLAGIERLIRLIIRRLKHWRDGDSVPIIAITNEFIRRRIFMHSKERLRLWNRENTYGLAQVAEHRSRASAKPKVSVCMAAYNGGEYIAPQINSILEQLSGDDEIVVVDDCSTDGTREWLRTLRDPRIRLIEHQANVGVIETFETALRAALGAVLFLADDDDLWHPNKVHRFIEIFSADPEVTIVSSAVTIINRKGDPSQNPRELLSSGFTSKFWPNVYKNRFQGSAIALRASFLGDVLPFPKKRLFLHDAWIGTRNALIGGKVVYIDDKLLLYRRHGANLSNRLPRYKQIFLRIQLIGAHLGRILIK